MRPIDADEMSRIFTHYGDGSHYYDANDLDDMLAEMPTLDVVPVVRCHACENCTLLADGVGFHCKEWDMDFYAPHYDVTEYYCADGKRR